MTTKALSVWSWIAKQCHEREWHSAANVAEFLDGVEKQLWGNRHRETWIKQQQLIDISMFSSSYPANFLVAIARDRHLKWGCFVTGYDCDECPIAKKQGRCNQRGSISHFWQYVLLQDSQEEIDEKLQEEMKGWLVRIWMK